MPIDLIEISMMNICELWIIENIVNCSGIVFVSFYSSLNFRIIQNIDIMLPDFRETKK